MKQENKQRHHSAKIDKQHGKSTKDKSREEQNGNNAQHDHAKKHNVVHLGPVINNRVTGKKYHNTRKSSRRRKRVCFRKNVV